MSAIISLTRIKKAAYSLQWRFIIAYLLIIIVAFGVVAASVIQLVGEYPVSYTHLTLPTIA